MRGACSLSSRAQLCALGLPEQTVLIRGSLKLEAPLVWSPLPRRVGCRKKAGLQSGGSARWGAGCVWGPVRFMRILRGLFVVLLNSGASGTSVSRLHCRMVLNSSVNSLSEGMKHISKEAPSPRALMGGSDLQGVAGVGGVKKWGQPSIPLTLCWPLSCYFSARVGAPCPPGGSSRVFWGAIILLSLR